MLMLSKLSLVPARKLKSGLRKTGGHCITISVSAESSRSLVAHQVEPTHNIQLTSLERSIRNCAN